MSEAQAPSPRIVAAVGSYPDLLAALRTRASELEVTYATIERLALLADGHVSKLLSTRPAKHLGLSSFGPLLYALGLKMLLVEDAEALAVNMQSQHWETRCGPTMLTDAEHRPITIYVNRRLMRRLARKSVEARKRKIPPEQRSKIARNAAQARWQRHREASQRQSIDN